MKKNTGICLFIIISFIICGISFGLGYSVSHVRGMKNQKEIKISKDEITKDEIRDDTFRYILYENNTPPVSFYQ